MSKIKITVLMLVAIIIFLSALFIGPRIINSFRMGDIEKEIIFSIRFLRVVVALLIGMALGASGAVLQGLLRNPLSDPYILGISSGASLAAALGLLSGMGVHYTANSVYRSLFG